ncbi:MAG: type II toxin-antitoxin system RatA family toxin [Proteobacteria bacterium]|nr:type II toxin-antitoxin system RatA family toxin [Pseudomonadota bacterium]
MTRIQRSARLPHSAAQMYALVNDIEAYPEFVTWCVGSEVTEAGEHVKQATLHFAKGAIHASLTTRNELIRDRSIVLHLVKGPFRHLSGTWEFQEVDAHSCDVELLMEFKFSNRLFELTLGPIFSQVANGMIATFKSRAKVVYGGG